MTQSTVVTTPSVMPGCKLSSGENRRRIFVLGYVVVGLVPLCLLTILGGYQWPGYNEFKRQVQIRDETQAKNPITIAKFVHHVGRSVAAFLRVSLVYHVARDCT